MNEDAHASKKGGTAVKIRPLLSLAEGFLFFKRGEFTMSKELAKTYDQKGIE